MPGGGWSTGGAKHHVPVLTMFSDGRLNGPSQSIAFVCTAEHCFTFLRRTPGSHVCISGIIKRQIPHLGLAGTTGYFHLLSWLRGNNPEMMGAHEQAS